MTYYGSDKRLKSHVLDKHSYDITFRNMHNAGKRGRSQMAGKSQAGSAFLAGTVTVAMRVCNRGRECRASVL